MLMLEFVRLRCSDLRDRVFSSFGFSEISCSAVSFSNLSGCFCVGNVTLLSLDGDERSFSNFGNFSVSAIAF